MFRLLNNPSSRAFYGLKSKQYATLIYNGASEKEALRTLRQQHKATFHKSVVSKTQMKEGKISNISKNGDISANALSFLPESHFEIVRSSNGSLLYATLPPGSTLNTLPNAIVAHSHGLSKTLTLDGRPWTSLAKKIGGANLFTLKVTSALEKSNNDAILSAKDGGDIHIVSLDGLSEYHIQRTAYLASTQHLTLKSSLNGLGLGSGGLFSLQVSGKGQLAIKANGAIFRMVLEPGEKYYIHPSCLLGWNSLIWPKRVKSTFENINTEVKWKNFILKNVRSWLNGIADFAVYGRNSYELVGPGDFYISVGHRANFLTRAIRKVNIRQDDMENVPKKPSETTPRVSPESEGKGIFVRNFDGTMDLFPFSMLTLKHRANGTVQSVKSWMTKRTHTTQ